MGAEEERLPLHEKLKAIEQEMDRRYAAGAAYDNSLAVDRCRGEAIRAAVRRLVTPNEDNCRALEIGCGAGDALDWLWGSCRPARYVGLDISEVVIARARQRWPVFAWPAIQFVASPIETWRAKEQFDQAVAVESIEHWADVDVGLDNIHHALRPEGELVLTTPNRDSLHCRIGRKLGVQVPYVSNDHVHEFGFEELIQTVTRHGFVHDGAIGAALAPYWALESKLGSSIRRLTDADTEVNNWLNEIAAEAPAEFAFIQCHRFFKSR